MIKSLRLLLAIALAVPLGLAASSMVGAGAIFTVYDASEQDQWQSAVGSWETEDFNDSTLNDGLTVASDGGSIYPPNQRWEDQVGENSSPPPTTLTTVWNFSEPIVAFGGYWIDLYGPGGGLSIVVDGLYSVLFGPTLGPESPPYLFWGFVSSEPFTTVTIQLAGLGPPVETYALEDMVYVYANRPPVADAGPDQTVEATAQMVAENVQLDGTNSSDPDGDLIEFSWSAVGIVFDDPTSVTPTATFPLGSTEVTLTVTDPYGLSDTDQVVVEVVDTTPPEIMVYEAETPSGKKKPPAIPVDGNADGFFELTASDICWPTAELQIFVIDTGSGTVFGPFSNGVKTKYDIDQDAVPETKLIGSQKGKAKAGEIDWHIIGNGAAEVTAVDGSGNSATVLLE